MLLVVRKTSLFPASAAPGGTETWAGHLGVWLNPVLGPLGIDPKLTLALIFGFVAKEIVIGSLAVIYAREGGALVTGQRVVLAIRPERAALAEPGRGTLSGTLSNIVYFGTDTHYHIDLDGGGAFTVRMQNLRGSDSGASA